VIEGESATGSEAGATDPRLTIAELYGHPFGIDPGGVRLTGNRYPLPEVRLLAPVLPSKVVAAGRNYASPIREANTEEPVLFLKPSTSVTGPGDAIKYPVKLTDRVDFEGELAVIIGRLCRGVPRERADEVIFGYTCANDVTARDLQARDAQWTRAKGFDTFCPLGPWIETGTDPADLELTTTVNGTVRQRARTSEMLRDVPALVAYVSQVMTLLPGDVLLTGTPEGVGPLTDGDEVSVTIQSIGTLTNRVVIGDLSEPPRKPLGALGLAPERGSPPVAVPERRKFAAPVLAQAASFVVVLVIGGFTGHSPAAGPPGPTRASSTPPSSTPSAPPGVKQHQSGLTVEVPLSAATGGISVQIPVRVLNATTMASEASGSLSRNVQDTELSMNAPLPAGTYQVCAQPNPLRFTDKNTGVLPGWVCQAATVTPGEQTTVIFHLEGSP
jgi:2-keto-4-pentenoate hydratase/2-oxohepta-3-ene-1,7-dioic acid hydratase in catechol pathway